MKLGAIIFPRGIKSRSAEGLLDTPVVHETQRLRQELAGLAELARNADPELRVRYDLLRDKPPATLGARIRRMALRGLASLGLAAPPATKFAWLPTLKHAQPGGEYRTLVIWAVGVERAELRRCCESFVKRLDAASGIVPVLITDVADFAYYSRLKWLVEYVPDLSGDGTSYRERKQRYLAWRYRDALVVPAAAGCADLADWNRLMEMES